MNLLTINAKVNITFILMIALYLQSMKGQLFMSSYYIDKVYSFYNNSGMILFQFGMHFIIIIMLYSIVFYGLAQVVFAAQLPCPPTCTTCSSSTQCIQCGSQYYPSVQSGTMECLPCPDYCLTCSSSSECTRCMDPFVLNATDLQCYACEIAYAVTCSSIVSASSCEGGRYVSDNYCYSCLLNCQQCSSNSDCQSCMEGYFLNSSVLTCNLCPTTCLSCDQYDPNRCLTCKDGYSLTVSYNCEAVSCSLANCQYCSSNNVCGQCDQWYYWSSSTQSCINGASIMCENGAEGPFPNQCNNQCNQFSYEGQESSSQSSLWCIPYRNVRISQGGASSEYSQNYYYLYNQYSQFAEILTDSSISALTLEENGEYSLQLTSSSSSPAISFSSMASYYQLTISLKYRTAASQTTLSLSATTEESSDPQTQTMIFSGSHESPIVSSAVSTYLHSNNLQIQIAADEDIYLVELLVKAKKCPEGCYRCLNDDLCEMCEEPQYVSSYKCVDNCTIYYHMVSNRTCLTACPDQYYPNILSQNSKFCEPCQAPCEECIDSTKCLTCTEGTYFLDYECLTECPDGYFQGSSSRQCEPCISPCKLCINETTCLSCDEGFWDGEKCSNICPSGSYGDNQTNQCKACESPCATCRDSATKCLTCLDNYYFYENKCLEECPARYYPSTSDTGIKICSQCVPPCLECSSETDCLSCSYNYLHENGCVRECPEDGYYEDISLRTCSQCDQECLTCEMSGLCTACETGCYLDGQCVDECTEGEYYPVNEPHSLSNSTCWCLQCSYPCLTCLTATSCLSCLEGFYFESNHSCLSICPVGYFSNYSTFVCESCSSWGSQCLQCNQTGCTRCLSPYILHNGYCLEECPDQHYSSSEKCQKCVAPCLNCISFTECLSCINPYILNEDTCLIQCPFGQVSVEVNSSNICIECQSPCLACSVDASNCTMCVYGYYLYDNLCYLNCSSELSPQNTFYNELITSTCTGCMFPCNECLSQTYCLSCQIGYLTSENKCENCPYGSFANDETNACQECPSECSICYSYEYCLACHEGYYLYNHQCVGDSSICVENGYYAVGRKCQLCSMPCQTCNLTSTNCLTCLTGYIFYSPNKCITDCPKGTYRASSVDGASCEECHQYCLTCSTSPTYCFSCADSYLHVPASMTCVTECPDFTYEQGNTTCLPCRYPCRLCTSETSCLSCLAGTLIGDQCLTSCPEGQFSNSDSVCETCTSPCKQCQGEDTSCTQCEEGYYLFNSQCLQECPALYFPEEEAKQCLGCLGLCQECQSHINCTTCSSDLIFYFDDAKDYGQCLSECPLQFFNSSEDYGGSTRWVCESCRSDCLTCQDETSCLLCLDNKPQYGGECLTECPERMYVTSGLCQQCSDPCYNCTDTFTCTSCMDNSFLLVGSAQCIQGDTCPPGFYLLQGTRLCNGECPSGYYHRNDRTCNSDGCQEDEYKGADMFCYSQCPDKYISNSLYECVSCSDEECENGLFYEISSEVKRDRLFLYLIFTQDPVYSPGVTQPDIALNPSFEHDIYLYSQSRRRRVLESTDSPRNITIELFPTSSFSDLTLTFTFNQALATYTNPLQRPSKNFFLDGFDLYPDLPTFNIGPIALICALLGLVKYPYMVDFSQILFLLALLNLHYPAHLASALQSTSLAHLNGFVDVDQGQDSLGLGKFSYVTSLGLLNNCTFNFIIIGAGLCIFGIIFLIYQILAKTSHYNRVDQDVAQNDPEQVQSNDKNQEDQESPIKRSIFECLKNLYIQKFTVCYLNRLLYFNYLPITLFTFSQLGLGATGGTIGIISFCIAILSLLTLTIGFPIVMFRAEKPKYTFLMIRKAVLSLALVLSVENPTYMIGVTAVVLLMTSLLVGAYKIEKWVPENRFIIGMQILEFLLMVMLAIFAMIGDGKSTNSRVKISWGIIFLCLLIWFLYVGFGIFELVLWSCKRFRGVDYKEEWAKKDGDGQTNDKDSQTNTNQDMKDNQSRKEGSSMKSVQIQKMLNNMNRNSKDHTKEDGLGQPVVNNNQLFWTYNENEDEDKSSQGKAPNMLIRCINEFSDYDPNEKKEE